MENMEQIAKKFAIKGEITDVAPYGNGHINKTFVATTTERKYILQRINSNVFKDIDALMNNIVQVTNHLMEKNVFTLKYKPTLQGSLYYHTGDDYYRMFKYIDNTICYEGIDNMELVYKLGEGFGQFHNYLSDLDPTCIKDVIPDFHNTPRRYKKLFESVIRNPVNRVANVKDILIYINEHEKDACLLTDALHEGRIRNTITHNDPKINNILFDATTNNIKAVIDLDTVMTGTVLYDVGDALRSLFTGKNESSKDLSQLKVNFEIYENYLKGYWSEMKNVLNKEEIRLIPYSVIVLTLELVIRFLTDYIDGDVYFATKYPEHNLDRCKTQFALLQDLYKNIDKLSEITNKICK